MTVRLYGFRTLPQPPLTRFRCGSTRKRRSWKERLLGASFRFGILTVLNGIGHTENPGNAYRQRNVSTLLLRRYATYRTLRLFIRERSLPLRQIRSPLPTFPLGKPPQRAPTYSRLASDPLFTVGEMATRLNVSKGLGVGSLFAEDTSTAGHLHGRRHANIPRERN